MEMARKQAAQSTCTGCRNLAPMGLKCNAHRTEARSAELVRKAREAGHNVSDWREAETALKARPVYMN
jgi:hypothetical protein